jgi:putative addiction module component (TIGR02574 family)
MPHTFEEVRQIASELPRDQRIELASSLWESVEGEEAEATEADIAAWDGEIARRAAGIKDGTAKTCSANELEADLRAIVGP